MWYTSFNDKADHYLVWPKSFPWAVSNLYFFKGSTCVMETSGKMHLVSQTHGSVSQGALLFPYSDICLRAPLSSTLAWKIPWMEEPGRLQSMGLLRVGYHWVTALSLFTFMHWRRKWQPTPVFLPGESQGRGSLVGCRLWGRTESDTTGATQQQQQHAGGESWESLGLQGDQTSQS